MSTATAASISLAKNKKRFQLPGLVLLGVLLIDQVSKFMVKLNMYLNEEFSVLGDWFIIHFTENPGMAFGMEFGGDYGKLFLTLFRIVAVFFIARYIVRITKEGAPKGAVIGVTLILAGALGNIIDSVFYGVIFSDSYYSIAQLFPEGGGYGTWMHGKVVDMLYFPLISGFFPDWVPLLGGDHFIFFRPIFNIADTAISVGVGMILLFHRKFFAESLSKHEKD